jgi:hypothetical protein
MHCKHTAGLHSSEGNVYHAGLSLFVQAAAAAATAAAFRSFLPAAAPVLAPAVLPFLLCAASWQALPVLPHAPLGLS